MSTTTAPGEIAARLRQTPLSDLFVFVDVDGTLAPIVDDPADVAVPASSLKALEQLVGQTAGVAVVTGRSLEDARRLVPVDGVWVAAAHGMHLQGPDGSEDRCAVAEAVRPELDNAVTLARTVGWRFEDKGHSVTVHFRHVATPELTARGMRAQMSTVLDPRKLEIHDARMALEIRPVGGRTKAWAVRHLLDQTPGARRALFIGDDRTDLDAFEGLAETDATCVAVNSDEAPAELIERADVVLEGQHDVDALLCGLVDGQ